MRSRTSNIDQSSLQDPRSNLSRIVSLLPVLVLLAGCTTYQNITGYFNTYYNASRLFRDGEKEIRSVIQKDLDTNYFAAFKPTPGSRDKFDKVIEKCSKLIESYDRSVWVDRAIVMIAKSYLYSDELESSIRKFQELLDNFPTSELRSEAELWLAKAKFYSKKEEDAIGILQKLIPEAEAEGQTDIALEGTLLWGQIQFQREDYQGAAERYDQAVGMKGNDVLLAVAFYQRGRCNERLGKYREAAESYARVEDYKPTPGTGFLADLKTSMMRTAAGDYDGSLENLKDMKRQPLSLDERGLVELEIGNTYTAMGDTLTSFGVYRFIDTAYRRSDASAKANYERGKYFELKLGDYKSALPFYDIARTENTASVVTPLAQKESDYIAKYFALRGNVVKFDTVLYHVLHPDTNAARKKLAQKDSLAPVAAKDDSAHPDLAAALPDTERVKPPPKQPPGEPPPAVGTAPDDSQDDNEIPYHRRGMGLLIGMFNENAAAAARQALGKEGAMARGGSASASAARDPRIAAIRAKKVGMTPDSLRAAIAEARFEIAGLFMLEMKLPDSAQFWYQSVLDSFPSSPLVPRILYALAEIHREKNDTLAVDSLYKVLLNDYANTEYGIQVKKLLGMTIDTTAHDSAETLYGEASKALSSGKDTSALQILQSIVHDHPASPFAAKAQYAVGWIYENRFFNNDSAASVYKKLITLYPSSVYASVAQPKVAVKDDPKSLSKFIKIKEIVAVQKTESPRKAAAAELEKQLKHGRGKNEGVEEDTTDDSQDDQKDEESTTDDTSDD